MKNEMRGEGDLFGVKQSGDMVFSVADLKRDYNILLKAKEDSVYFLENEIEKEENKNILELIKNNFGLD